MIALNGLPAVSVRVVTPWNGAWFAEVDLELPDPNAPAPIGPAVITIGTNTLTGTVDARGSGKFGTKAIVRVVGGGGGWDKIVVPLPFHNDAGVPSSAVLSATAAEVGEVVTEAQPPKIFGTDYVRPAEAASTVLESVGPWYVTTAGVTVVGLRLPIPTDPTSVVVLNWNPSEQRAEIATDDLMQPGMILVDPHFGTATVRDVEQIFTGEGSARTNVWCGEKQASRLASVLAAFVREKSGIVYARKYRYRVVLQGPDGRLALQAVKRTPGLPDLLAISMWTGIPGAAAKPTPGSECLVEFANGDATKPVATSFEDVSSLEIDFNTLLVKVGAGTSPAARSAELLTWATALKAAIDTFAANVVASCAANVPTIVIAPLTTPALPTTVASTKLLTD